MRYSWFACILPWRWYKWWDKTRKNEDSNWQRIQQRSNRYITLHCSKHKRFGVWQANNNNNNHSNDINGYLVSFRNHAFQLTDWNHLAYSFAEIIPRMQFGIIYLPAHRERIETFREEKNRHPKYEFEFYTRIKPSDWSFGSKTLLHVYLRCAYVDVKTPVFLSYLVQNAAHLDF